MLQTWPVSGQHDQGRPWNRFVQARQRRRGARTSLSPYDQQRRDLDAGQHITHILAARAAAMRESQPDETRACSRRTPRPSLVVRPRRTSSEAVLRQTRPGDSSDNAQSLLQALLGDVGRKRACPSRVGGGEHQRRRDGWVAAIEREGQRAAERQADNVRPFEAERCDEAGQAVGVAVDAEVFRWVRRSTGTGCVPGDHGELVAEALRSDGRHVVGPSPT